MLQEVQLEENRITAENHTIPAVNTAFWRDCNTDRRHYTFPAVNKVATIS
jgi:hypothetical protein